MPHDSFMKLSDQRRKAIVDTGIAEFSQRSYTDVGTDVITKQCGISKGLLFHYFGSKKEYYFYCLEQAMKVITTPSPAMPNGNLHEVFFSLLTNKIRLCQQYPTQMRLSQMASRETCTDIKESKNTILTHYMAKSSMDTTEIMAMASANIRFKTAVDIGKATAALQIYVQSLINRYFEKYQDRPDAFFKNAGPVQKEFSEYIDFVLLGIAE